MRTPTTMQDIITRFLEHLTVEEEIRSPHTIRYYRRWAGRWLAYCARRGKSWLEISRDDAFAFKLELVQAERWGAEAIRQAVLTGRKLYEWAMDEGWYPGPNPWRKIRAPHLHPKVKLAPREEEILAMLSQAWPSDYRALRARAVFSLLYGSMLRRNEARMLNVGDVDLTRGLVLVNHGKGGTAYIMTMPHYTVVAVREYLEAGRPLIATKPTGPLFLGVRGGRISYDGVASDVEFVSKRIRRLTPHDLRRGGATHMHQHGATLAEVQRALRHVSITSTQRYLGIAAQDVERAITTYHPLSKLTA